MLRLDSTIFKGVMLKDSKKGFNFKGPLNARGVITLFQRQYP